MVVRMLAHAEIVFGAPDGDFPRLALMPPDRLRKLSCDPLQIGEHPVAALGMESLDRRGEMALVINHRALLIGTVLSPPIRIVHNRGLRPRR